MGGVRGLSERKLDAINSPNAHKENTLIPVFQGGGGEKYIFPVQRGEIILLRETSKRKRKLPTMVFLMANFFPFMNFQIKKENIF
jgi:hypothetical protein